MSRKRTQVEKAAGKLVSAIQKEWGDELGEPRAEQSENVMYLAHDLLQTGNAQAIRELLGSRSVIQFLGESWVREHPSVLSAICSLEQAMEHEDT